MSCVKLNLIVVENILNFLNHFLVLKDGNSGTMLGHLLFYRIDGLTTERYEKIQRRVWVLYFVILLGLAIKHQQPFALMFVASEFFVDKNPYELWGSTIFGLFLFLHVLLPYGWPLFLLEQFLLNDRMMFGFILLMVFFYSFIYEFYLILPFVACLGGSKSVIALRLVFAVYYTNLLVHSF